MSLRTDATCKDCRFYHPLEGEPPTPTPSAGECRRYAPRPRKVKEALWPDWPKVWRDDWCGEWELER